MQACTPTMSRNDLQSEQKSVWLMPLSDKDQVKSACPAGSELSAEPHHTLHHMYPRFLLSSANVSFRSAKIHNLRPLSKATCYLCHNAN